MNHRSHIIISVLFILLSAFSLSAQNEYDGKISIDRTIHDFGDILESDGPQSCVFTVKNISKEPVVIHRVVSNCGCTEPDWTKEPIRPGASGTIKVTYKNDSGPYPFDRSITTYITGIQKPIILRIKGIVREKGKTLKELYPYRCGPIALREEMPDLGQIEQGMSRNEEFEVANTSNKSMTVEFTNLTRGLEMTLTPNPLPSGAKGKVTCVINTEATSKPMWGRTVFSATAREKGNPANAGTVSVKTLIKENFTSLTESQRNAGSLIKFTETSLSFGSVRKGEIKTIEFQYTNEGRSPLIIYKVDSSEPGASVTFTPEVKYSEKGKITMKIDTNKCPKGEILFVMTVITNSPLRPLATFFATGTIK